MSPSSCFKEFFVYNGKIKGKNYAEYDLIFDKNHQQFNLNATQSKGLDND